MKYFKFTVGTPYCGTEEERYLAFPDGVTEKELEEYAEEMAHDQGESYEYMVFGWGVDPVEDGEMSQEEYDEQIDDFYADCYCEYIEVSEEEFNENGGVEA